MEKLRRLPTLLEVCAQAEAVWPLAAPATMVDLRRLACDAAATLSVFGGEYVGLFVGAHVRTGLGDDASLLFTEADAGLAVIATFANPRVPTRVPLDKVTVVLPTLPADIAQLFAKKLAPLSSELRVVLEAGNTPATAGLFPRLVCNPVHALVADLQVHSFARRWV